MIIQEDLLLFFLFLFLTILFWKYELIGLWSGVLLSILIFVQIWGVIHLLEDVNNHIWFEFILQQC